MKGYFVTLIVYFVIKSKLFKASANGNLNEVIKLLNVNEQDSLGWTALMIGKCINLLRLLPVYSP